MLDKKRFALNRIACPKLSLREFFALAKSLGLTQVELRNDLGGTVMDGLSAAEVRSLAENYGVRVITINALQKFNLEAVRAQATSELEQLAQAAKAIGCGAIVLCPNNDTADHRPQEQMFKETVAALRAFAPIFEKSGLWGFVEPLGFAESSLRSGVTAMAAIAESGSRAYRIVHDTFHHHLGTNPASLLSDAKYAAQVGLIHASGVASDIGKERYRDAHRVLPSASDQLRSKEQLHALTAAGCSGPISFEPFASEVQALAPETLREQLGTSLGYLS